jgi:hypothetical protein
MVSVLFRDLGLISPSSLPIWGGIIFVPGNSQNPPQGGLRNLKLAPDFLERNLGLPELKGSSFFSLEKVLPMGIFTERMLI